MSTRPATAPATDLAEDLHRQRALLAGQVPVYDRLLAMLEPRAGDPRFAAVWSGYSFSAFYDRPLLLLASLRDGALAHPDHPLRLALADAPDPASLTESALDASLDREDLWVSLRDRHVQTNETSRAVAWLLAAAELGWEDLDLADLGCSAGLNLIADRISFPWTLPDGQPVIEAAPRVWRRVGIDAHPLDPANPDDARWLRACVWPGQASRLARLDEALSAFQAARPRLIEAPLSAAPALLAELGEDRPVLACQTLVRDYLPLPVRVAYEAGMRAWVGPDRAWVELEYFEGGDPCLIVLHWWDGALRRDVLGACNYHPSVVRRAGAGLEG